METIMAGDYLDTPLLDLAGGCHATYRDFGQNILVFGVIGGGKSSGPGAHILSALAQSDAGGIICCAKSSEGDEVYAVLKKAGREQSVIRWNGRNGGFNFLAWALARLRPDGLNSVIEYLTRIVEITRHAGALRGHDGDAFWLDEFKRVLRHTLGPVHLATGTLRMMDILAFVRSAPTAPEQFSDPQWQAQRPFFFECFRAAADALDEASGAQLLAFWQEFARMDTKLRSSILATFTMLDRFCHGWLRDATGGETTILPALCFHGAVIILDMSRATLGEDGIILQMIFKDAFQTEVLGRAALAPEHRERFVYCYADEAQEVMNAGRDAEFFAMSRSARCSTIYLTQSLPAIYTKLGGANAHDRALHLIAGMGVRVLCANNCNSSNFLASETIGKSVQQRANHSASAGSSTSLGASMGDGSNWGSSTTDSRAFGGGNPTTSWNASHSQGGSDNWGRNRGTSTNAGTSDGWSEQVDWIVPPDFFARGLKTGAPATGFRVSAIWTQVGKRFATSGGPAMLVEFEQ